MAEDETQFYYIRVNPHPDRSGRTGAYRKALELKTALTDIGLIAGIQTEDRAAHNQTKEGE